MIASSAWLGRVTLQNVTRSLVQTRCRRPIAYFTGSTKLDDLAEQLKATDKASAIHSIYPRFVAALKEAGDHPKPLKDVDVKALLRTLAASGRPDDMQRVSEIIHELLPKIGVKPTVDLYTAVSEGLVHKDAVNAAIDWIAGIPSLQNATTDRVNTHFTNLACPSFASLIAIVEGVLRRLNLRANAETVQLLVQKGWTSKCRDKPIPSVEEMQEVLQETDSLGAPWDLSVSQQLLSLYAGVGQMEDGRRLQTFYDRNHPSSSGSARKDTSPRLGSEAIRTATLANVEEGLVLYRASRAANVPVDSATTSLLLRRLSNHPSAGSDGLLLESFTIYYDLATSSSGDSPVPGVFRSLFQMINLSRNLEKHYPDYAFLLEELKRYNIEITPGMAGHMVCIEMRRAPTAEEAMDVYHARKRLLDPNGYVAVLQQFMKLSFGMSSTRDYFTIVKDMQRAGMPTTSRAYTVLLTQIGTMASEMRANGVLKESVYHMLVNATRRTHDHLTLDPNITPTEIVFSQLINTYQRLGCLGDAYRVWELLYLTGRVTPHSISNILDGCGYAKEEYIANMVWKKLAKDGYPFDVKHYETYVECLCRCGNIDAAMEVLLSDMKQSGFDRVNATKILLRFSAKRKVYDSAVKYLRAKDPALYEAFQANIQSNRTR